MLETILIDFARFGHFVGFAFGIGAGCFADYSIIKKLDTAISPCDIAPLEVVHKIVWTGLGLLWLSGFILLFVRTGFVPSAFSPKLIVKLLVVSILTLNAVLLGMIAMPILRKNVDQPYITFTLEHKTILCFLAGISTCSWISGLVLGIFSALKPTAFSFMVPFFGFAYIVSIAGAIGFAAVLHIIWERRRGEAEQIVVDEHNTVDQF